MRVGVIGVGSMGQNHARVYSEIAELVGVADSDEKVARAVAERFGVRHFTDYKELLKENLDAVSVATPTELHHPIGMDVLRAGVNLLLEKPMCSSVKESREILDAAENAGLTLAVGLIERHNPVVDFTKRALSDGQYGDLITATARRVSSFPDRIRDVGVIMDLAIHDIDVLRYLVGSEVESVFALAGMHKHERFEDHANVLLQFKNGIFGFVEANWLTPMKVRKVALTCTENFVELDYTAQALTISSSKLTEFDPFNLYRAHFEYDVRTVNLQKEEPLKRELQDFLDAVRRKGKPLVDGEEGLKTLEVVEAAIRSQRERRRVDLS